MRLRKQKLVPFFALMFAALLALPSVFNFNPSAAAAFTLDQTRNDVKAKPKTRHGGPHIPNGTAPSNDDCANAKVVTSANCPYTDTVDTSEAGDEAGEPQSTCTLQANSVWYSFTSPTHPATVSVATCSSSPLDTALMVWEPEGGPCDFANFTPVACNDDACGDGLQSQLSFTAEAGVTYKIQAGGFDGDTGNLTIDIDCAELLCDPISVSGTLGSGSPDWPSTSGLQTPNRIFRDGVPSSCAAPKACPGTFGSGSFNYDAYTFTNESSDPQCVTVNYDPNSGGNPGSVNLHAVVYLGSYTETVCPNYLADSGSSDTLAFSFTVPGGTDFVVVIVANNPGTGVGQTYSFTIVGNICRGFDYCIQGNNALRFIQFNSETGAYLYTDCSKGLTLEGTGTITVSFCKLTLTDSGPVPKSKDRTVNVQVNTCTRTATAQVVRAKSGINASFSDSNIDNNNCTCPGPQ